MNCRDLINKLEQKPTIMKKLCLLLIVAFPLFLEAQNTTITIDVNRKIGDVDPKIYGVFMEPIHFNGRRMGLPDTVDFNTVYGNLYDPPSPLADENGFRKDYIEAGKELKVTNMRWPGGNFLMQYNWKDGIGPKDQRPTRINLAWGGLETNQVGTDEWIQLNKSVGSQNVIGVNLGLGDINNAQQWVEYCNYKKGTYYSDLRIKNGHTQPYNVKIWDLGNEVDGKPWELGYKNADDYVKIAHEAAKAMKAVDNSIQLVASGSSWYEETGIWIDWNRKILDGLGDKINYISIHRYWEGSKDYYAHVGAGAMDFDEKIRLTAQQIDISTIHQHFDHPIYISVDEWGSFGRNFMNVLPVAECFNAFIRHADVVKMANFTMFTSLLSSDPKNGTFKTPLFYTFKMFSNNCLGASVDTYVDGDTFDTDKYKKIPYLDATTVYSKEKNTLIITVVNRNKEKSITSDIESVSGTFSEKAQVQIINSQSLDAPFTFDKKDQYVPETKEIKTGKNSLSFSFPAHSITQITATLN